MQNVVTLFKHTVTQAPFHGETGIGYSLDPFEENIDYKGFDDDGKAYVLPTGFRATESGIFDAKGYPVKVYVENDAPHVSNGYAIFELEAASQ